MSDAQAQADPAATSDSRRGRTQALSQVEVERLFRTAVALFNGARYWHAHEAWETLWRAAPDEERDFYQGLVQVAAGLLVVNAGYDAAFLALAGVGTVALLLVLVAMPETRPLEIR